MDQRLYFVLGDLALNILAGALIGWLIWLITPAAWNMWPAMLLGMFLGMLFAAILFIPAGIFFGAMEVMMPLMLTGMVSGMVIAMRAGMLSGGGALFEGAVCGLACIVAVWVLNNSLRGTQPAAGQEYRND